MRKVVTTAQMRALDRAASDEWGLPGIILMENAGRAAADELLEALPELAGMRVAILCGRGNNGGDGFVICRHLLNRGVEAGCFLLGEVANLVGDARSNADILLRADGPVIEVTEPDQLAGHLAGVEVVVDALLGTGLESAPRGLHAEAIELVNSLPAFVMAVDVPSGVDADTGHAFEPAVRADLTVTMGLRKRGLLLHPGRELAGDVVVADIGIPETHLVLDFDTIELEDEDIPELLPERPLDGHKGTFGTALLVAGSRGYTGAACLAGRAAIRAGAGLVRLAFPAGAATVIESCVLEAVKFPLAETPDGVIDPRAVPVIIALARDSSCLAIGPGIGAGPASQELVRTLLPLIECPLVIDADALNCLVGATGLLRELQQPAVLTPHPGELARLIDRPAAEVNRDRIDVAREFAVAHGVVLLLKGAPTVVAAPDGLVFVNPTGNSGLGSGGTGDVLTGLIAGLLAQHGNPLDAALAGAWLHGRAGDLAEEELTEFSLAAGDLVDFLPGAFASALEPPDDE